MKLVIQLSPLEMSSLKQVAKTYSVSGSISEPEQLPRHLIVYVDNLLKAIDSDERKHFKKLAIKSQVAFLSLARQLGRTLETKWEGSTLPAPMFSLLSMEVSNVSS